MAINRTSKARGKIIDVPTAPTIETATGGPGNASVAFTPATVGGPAFSYTALSNPGSITATGTSSPITVSGLTAGTSYTFSVRGNNPSGNGQYSSSSNAVTPFLDTAFESIATVTVGASPSVSTLQFSSIPQTYAHLQFRLFMRSNGGSGGTYGKLVINSDSTNSNYAQHYMTGYGTGVIANGNATDGAFGDWTGALAIANNYGVLILDILDYTNTNKNKVCRLLGGYDDNGNSGSVRLQSILWKNASAITSIGIQQWDIANFTQYTHAALYGVKRAS